MAKDYYETLGISKGANSDEIKSAYKKMAKKFHPDLNKEKGAEDKFKEVNQAYSILSDDKKRANYDQFGEQAEQASGSGYSDFSSSFQGAEFSDMFGDIFENFFEGSSFGGRHGRGRNSARRGRDLQYEMELTLEDANFGTTKTIVIPKTENCPDCGGSGAQNENDIDTCPDCKGSGAKVRVQRTPFGMFQQQYVCNTCSGTGKYITKKCSKCHGKGNINLEKTIEVKIPKGVETGTRIRLTGEGEAGERGGSSGDLYIVCNILEHDIFERTDDDLLCEVTVPYTMVVLGGEVSVPTLDGDVTLKIPAGTQSNTIFRLKEKGMSHLRHEGHGNLLVRCVIDVPTKLSSKQKELLKDYDKTISSKKGFFSKIKEAFE
jgi:molecular chaperone DnaJ